jgi:DNA-binding transcriptional ArsR family regulator
VSEHRAPDYELDEVRVVTTTAEITAMFHPLRGTILELVLQRAASVDELASALRRPPSTVAYHVGVLADADLVRVVRTRRRRAIEQRFYGRTARIFYVGAIGPEQLVHIPNLLAVAAAESGPAHEADDLRAILRHARITGEQAAELWHRVLRLVDDFSSLPPDGDSALGLVVGLYPTEHPALPPADDARAAAIREET